MSVRAIALTVALAAVVPEGAGAQTTFTTTPGVPPQQPGRPAQPGAAAAEQPPGTAVLRGFVVAADTGQPLRKAQVRITQADVPAGPNVQRDSRLTTTDPRGLFEFRELRAGRYTLLAAKGSYVSMQYGQTRPNEPGKPIEILDGQTIERVGFNLPPGGVITGRILDEYGEPLSDVTVTPQRYQYVQGQRRLVPAGRVGQTDDLGDFRIFGVPPGQYYLQATYRNFAFGTSEDRVGYAPVYFPGTTEMNMAQRLTIGVGTQVSNVVMTMRPVKTARVSGTVVDSHGRPMMGMLLFMQASGFMVVNMAAPIRPDGTFSMSGLAPGEYILRAQQNGRPPTETEVAFTRITIGTEDVDGLQLAASPPSVARGRVIVDPAAAASLPSRLMISATPVQLMFIFGPMMPATVADDMSFELRSTPGRYRATLAPTGPGWAVRSVRLNGTDVTDAGFEIKAGEELTGLEVEITNRLTTITGVVTNARGEALKDYTTIVFAQEPARWPIAGRYQSLGRPDQDGRYKVTGLAPGEYYIIALERVDTGDVNDPEFLERIKTKASTLTINEGETKQIDLRISDFRF